MARTDEIAVALIVFNRADCVAQQVAALRAVKPKRLLVIADGPRPGHADDPEACRRARAALDAVDWPTDLTCRTSATNLGCDRSTVEGLDWVFEQVEAAIVLDDDTVPAAGFFPWCAAMLDRYRGSTGISHVCGRNELGTWPTGAADHLLVGRGGLWGWATWAAAWREIRAADPASCRQAPLHPDPLVARYLAMLHAEMRCGCALTWDLTWSLAVALAGKLIVLPPANLVRNIGFGRGATHTAFAEDFRGALPAGTVALAAAGQRPSPDFSFDRWVLLVELLAAQRDGAALARLANARNLVRDERLRLHLAPFDDPGEAVAVLRHLAAAGTRSAHLDAVLARMESAANGARGGAP